MGFPHRIWVAGEVSAVRHGADGGLYFDLRATGEGSGGLRLPAVVTGEVLPEVGAVLDRMHDADVADLVCEGRLLRAGGLLRYHFAEHRLDFVVTALDPTTTSAGLAADQEAVRHRVAAERLAERQRVLSPGAAPVRVAVVGRPGSPAVRRVMERLSGSGYAVRARVVPVAAAGGAAAEHLAAAISAAAADADLVLLVREEGRRLGLAPFDSYPLARAIAATTVPVVTGIGGAEDHTVADEVAFEAAPTALAAADAVLARISAAEQRLRVARDDVRAQGVQALDRAGDQLAHARDEVEHTGREAERRAAGAANRRYRWVLAGAGVLALALVAVAVLAHSGWWLLGLVALVALVAGFHWQRTSYLRKGSRAMVAEVSFTEVLERLRRIRDELALTSSPEKVYRFSDEARQLVERGESVLGRPLDAVAEPLSPPSPPKVTAATADTVSIPSVPSAASSTAAVAGTEPPATTGATAEPATAPPR